VFDPRNVLEKVLVTFSCAPNYKRLKK